MLYDFKLGHNTVQACKNICYKKAEGIVDDNTVTRWFKQVYEPWLSGKVR